MVFSEQFLYVTNLYLFMGKIKPRLFLENIAKTQTLPSIYKGRGFNCGSRVEMSEKNNAISKKLLPFKRPQFTP